MGKCNCRGLTPSQRDFGFLNSPSKRWLNATTGGWGCSVFNAPRINIGFGCGCCCGGGFSWGNFWTGLGNACQFGLAAGLANGIMGFFGMGMNWLNTSMYGLFGGMPMFGGGGNIFGGFDMSNILGSSPSTQPRKPKEKVKEVIKTNADQDTITALQIRINNLNNETTDTNIKKLYDDIKAMQDNPDTDGISIESDRSQADTLKTSLSDKLATLGKQISENDNGTIEIKTKPTDNKNAKTADDLKNDSRLSTLGVTLSEDGKTMTFSNLNILFSKNGKYVVDDSYKDMLNAIIVVASDSQYKGLIRAVRITGCTNVDGDGKYDNEGLGAKRADAVRDKMKTLDATNFENIPAIETNNEWQTSRENPQGEQSKANDRHAKIEILLW